MFAQQFEKTETIAMNNRLNEHLLSANIISIEWERFFLHLVVEVDFNSTDGMKVDKKAPLEFYFVSAFFNANAAPKIESVDGNIYHLSVNITNPGYCLCLSEGSYTLVVCQKDDIMAVCTVSEELARTVHKKSKFFLHGGGSVAFCVAFFLAERDDGFYPIMRVVNTDRKGYRKFDNSDGLKLNFIERKCRGFKSRCRRYFRKSMNITYSIFRKFHKSNAKIKNVLIMSEQNELMKFNLKAVYDRLYERGLDKEYKIKKSFRSGAEKHSLISWIGVIKKLAKADFIFIDDHCPVLDWLTLSKGTVLSQLWHAGAGYKSVGYVRWGHQGSPAPFCCHRQYDYCISPSKNISYFFSDQFGINEEQILPTGMPRMDEYVDPKHKEEVVEKLYELYPMCKGKKVILFAPTYRGNNKALAYYPYEKVDFKELYDFCKDEYVVLFKMHPWVAEGVPIEDEMQDIFVDVGDYPDINDLFYITDLLISDYSSGIFEYSIMNKPALFYAFDEYQYAYTRGFHRKFRENAPGKICYTFDEVMKALREKDFEFEKIAPYVKYHFDRIDSKATDRVIDWILLGNLPKENAEGIARIKKINQRMINLDFSSMYEDFTYGDPDSVELMLQKRAKKNK